MMGRRKRDQGKLFYEFRLEDRIPENHLLRRMNVFVTLALADLHKELEPHYSEIGRPSVDPELMIRMLLVGYCYGIRSERRLCQEVDLHLAYRWFCKLDLDDMIPHHSTFSANRLGRFRESDVLRHIFERVVWSAMATGLVKAEGLDLPGFSGEPFGLSFGWPGTSLRTSPGSCSPSWNVACAGYRTLRCIGQWRCWPGRVT